MKTLVLLCSLVLLPLALSRGQTVVTDPTLEGSVGTLNGKFDAFTGAYTAAMNTLNTNLANMATAENNTATAITNFGTKLDNLSNILGDPSMVVSSGSKSTVKSSASQINASTKNSVQAMTTDLKTYTTKNSNTTPIDYSKNYPLLHFTQDTNGVPQVQSPAPSESSVYSETAGGLYTAIGTQYTPMNTGGSSGSTKPVDRGKDSAGKSDGVTYKGEAAELAAINDYYRVRDSALTRRETLQSTLADTVTALDTAPDFASVQKLAALVQALQSQIQACDNDVAIAFNDMAARGMQIYTMNSVMTKAGAEPAQAQVNSSLAAAQALVASPPKSNAAGTATALTPPAGSAAGYQTSFFPWTVYH